MLSRLLRGRAFELSVLLPVVIGMLVIATSAAADVQPHEVSEYLRDFKSVPTSQAEAALEMQDAASEGDLVAQLKRGLGQDYAGVWFDNASGEFVVPMLPGSSGATVSSQFAGIDLGGNDFRIAQAKSSWQDLEAAQDEIDGGLGSLREEELIETSLDPRTNAVVVGVAESADSAQRDEIHRSAASVGVQVEIRQAGDDGIGISPTACELAGQICDAPMRGGVDIEPNGSNIIGPTCTAGFKAIGNSDGRRYVLTAGHCIPGIKEWEAFTADYLHHFLGKAVASSFPVHDYAAIDATGTFWDTSPWPSQVVYAGHVNEGAPRSAMVNPSNPITGEGKSYLGEFVCHTGMVSGTSCGTVVGMGITEPVEGTGTSILNMTKFQKICSIAGDSGGPVFAGNTALGLFSGSDEKANPTEKEANEFCQRAGFYTEITEDTAALGVSVGTLAPQVKVQATALNGNPGWATISGQVTSPNGVTVTNKTVNIKLFKWEGSAWSLKATLPTTVTNGKFEIVNWNGVGPGQWLAKAVFPAQAPFGEASSDEVHEGSFTVKDGYRLVSKASGKCVDVVGVSKDNNASIDQWDCGNPEIFQNQVFTMVPQGAYVQLVNRNSGRCLDVTGANTADGAPLQQYSCLGAGQANQLWQVVDVGGGYFELRAKHSNKCLDLPGASKANGTALQQWSCNGSIQQKWEVQSVESAKIPTTTGINVPEGERLNGQPGFATVFGYVQTGAYGIGGNTLKVSYYKKNGAGSYEYIKAKNPTINSEGRYEVKYEGLAAGDWWIQAEFTGVGNLAGSKSTEAEGKAHIGTGYRFLFRHSNKCMSLAGNSAANGTGIIQWSCAASASPGDGQVFTIVPVSSNSFQIVINSTGKCLDVTGASTANGAWLQEWDCGSPGQSNQSWYIVPIAGQSPWQAAFGVGSGKCMDVTGASGADGVRVQQWECSWAPQQQWAFQGIG
jgi:hypothetical protein